MRKLLLLLCLLFPITVAAHDLEQETALAVIGTTVRINREGAQGSGVILWTAISEEDRRVRNTYVLTNHHVVDDAEEVDVTTFVYLRDRNTVGHATYSSSVVFTSEEADLALIEIQTPSNIEFKTATLISEDDWVVIAIYEEIYLSGCGTGASPYITRGNLSAINRLETQMEFTAHIIWGSSGGGLFNSDGELVGVCNAMRLSHGHPVTHQGLGIPITTIRSVLEESDYAFVLEESEEEDWGDWEEWDHEDDSGRPQPEPEDPQPDDQPEQPERPLREYF